MSLECDSLEYEIFHQLIPMIRNVEGMTLELGVRRGGGSAIIIDSLVFDGQRGRTHVCVDPYGHIPYETADNHITQHDYTNRMRDTCIRDLYAFVEGKPVNLLFFVMTDQRYFEYFANGVPIYDTSESLENRYAFVHYDGPHGTDAIIREMEFFNPRTPTGGIWVFDDILTYKHDEVIEPYLFDRGWKLITKGQRKAAYVKQ